MRAGPVLALLTLTAAALAAPAATASAASIPWQTYRTSPWTDQPGQVCAFGVAVTIVKDGEQERVLESYPDGSPELQEFRGPLYVRYTNQSTGASVIGNLSGYGWFTYESDGAIDAYVQQHIGLTVKVGNTGWPAGEWVISGQANVTVSPAGQISVQLHHAKADNICADLS
jgi:hypothetical protein